MSNPAPYTDVGQRILWHRERTGLSQTAYAKTILASRSQLSNWELGFKRPSIDVALAMADRYALTLDFIYLGDDTRLPADLREAWRAYRVALAI